MHIRLTTADTSAEPTLQGGLAAGVSLLLGVAAHGFGGGFAGHGPATSHVLILVALAAAVGAVRSRQVRGTAPGGVAAAIVGGQLIAHTVLALLGHGSLLPDAGMTAWHLVALPAAVAALVAVDRFTGLVARQIAVVLRLVIGAPASIVPATPFEPVRRLTSVLDSAAFGVRGPPATV